MYLNLSAVRYAAYLIVFMSAKIDPFGFVISYRCLIRISTYIMRKGNRKKSTEWYCGGRE